MARPTSLSVDQLLSVFHLLSDEWLAMRHITPHLAAARPTIVRRLADAIRLGLLEAQGQGPARQYRLRQDPASDAARYLTAREPGPEPLIVSPPWSDASRDLLQYVRQPKSLRTPVSYNAGLVENYQPNQTFLLPAGLRDKLRALGQATGERPAGTYVRDILGQLLIDLSWSSSKLEGNKYSRLETKQLIEAGQQAEGRSRLDAVMILNHKNAIEFLAEIAPHEEPYELVIANIQSLLMDGLMPNADVLGRIRERIVQIEGSVYIPLQSPLALRTLYKQVCSAAQATRDPLEAAFFLFTQLPYLQPFEDGNKRTARISCNLPLTRANYAPLSFTDVSEQDYFGALMALYERADLSVARDLFEWAYERSVKTYRAVKQSMQEPDPFRMRLRAALSQAICTVVAEHKTTTQAIDELALAAEDIEPFRRMLERELAQLTEYNFARYGLRFAQLKTWLENTRPRT